MPAWIPVCRHRVGCARIKKAISEHGAFQHAGARFRTRGVSERLSGVSGRLAFRNGFWRSGTTGVPERLLAFRDGSAGVLARVSAVPERRAVWNGWRRARDGRPAFRNGQNPFWDTRRPGTRFAVPERLRVFRGGNRRSRAGGGGVPERHRSELARRAACQHAKFRSGPRGVPAWASAVPPETASAAVLGGEDARWRAKMAGVRGRAGAKPASSPVHRPVPFDAPARRPKPSSKC